mmetsp:Transcript_33582/g.81193  ORF Transcript_33582/g.81193 Transcript_33582/m.81193 type:complete len:324 (-) Transcript_33582:34-1005(-)
MRVLTAVGAALAASSNVQHTQAAREGVQTGALAQVRSFTSSFSSQISQLQTAIKADLSTEGKSILKQIDEDDAAIQQLKAAQTSLTGILQQSYAQIELLQKQNAALTTRIQTMQASAQRQDQRHDQDVTLIKQYAAAQTYLQKVVQEQKSKLKSMSLVETQATDADSKAHQLSGEVVELNHQLSQRDQLVAAANKKASDLTAQITQLQQQMQVLQASKVSMETYESLEKQHRELVNKEQDESTALRKLRSRARKFDTVVSELHTEEHRHDEEAKTATADNTNLRKRVSELEEENAELKLRQAQGQGEAVQETPEALAQDDYSQ